jgi:hypothetical protein
MLYAYFGGLAADKHATYELLLEQHGRHYTVTAVTMAYPSSVTPSAQLVPRRWLGRAAGSSRTRRLATSSQPRLALRTLFSAACAANLAAHGQRYCYVIPSVPAQPGSLATLIPAQLRADGSLPIHPQLWQVGRSLDTLPVERHGQACTDALWVAKLTSGGPSLDEGGLR